MIDIVLNIFSIGEGSDGASLSSVCDEAYFAYNRYNFNLWNDPSAYYEVNFLGDLSEPAETMIAGEPCIKRHARVYHSEDRSISQDPGDPFLYYFPSKGYLFCVQYMNMATTEDESKPDEFLSSILVWE